MSDDDQEVVLHRRTLEERVDWLTFQVGMLTARISNMETARKGGRPRKELKVKADGVCGLNPEIDSSQCEQASLYRRRQGCLGINCVQASADYYKEYERE